MTQHLGRTVNSAVLPDERLPYNTPYGVYSSRQQIDLDLVAASFPLSAQPLTTRLQDGCRYQGHQRQDPVQQGPGLYLLNTYVTSTALNASFTEIGTKIRAVVAAVRFGKLYRRILNGQLTYVKGEMESADV